VFDVRKKVLQLMKSQKRVEKILAQKLLFLLFSFMFASVAYAQRPANTKVSSSIDMNIVRKSVNTYSSRIHSVLFSVKQSRRFYTNPVTKNDYEWGFNRGRIYQKRRRDDGTYMIGIYDGKTLQEVLYASGSEQTQLEGAVSKRSKGYTPNVGGPDPIEGIFRFSGKWLPEVVKHESFVAEKGPVHPEFGKTIRLLGKDDEGISYELHLAMEREWMCIYSRRKWITPVRDLEIKVTSMESNSEIWLPTGLHGVALSGNPLEKEKGKMTLWSEDDLKMEVLNLNHVPENLFVHRTFREGLSVLDSDTDQRLTVQDGKLVPKPQESGARRNMLNTWIFLATATPLLAGGMLLGAARLASLGRA
jgi:hypothetical protein